jgi:alpha-tubulin suppressor-like RCC1 family protein
MFPILLSSRRDTEQPTSGKLYFFGSGATGANGLGDTTQKTSPTQIGSNTNWVASTNGASSSFACNLAGKAYSWGQATNGRNGRGNTTVVSSPVQIGGLTDWVPKGPWAVGGGHDKTHFIKENGTLWAWGKNTSGSLGDGSTTDRSSPVQIGALTNWRYVGNSSGTFQAAIKTDGTLWSWGSGGQGRTGHNNTTAISSPAQVGSLTTWKHISAGSSSMTLTRTDGKMFTCGYGHNGQLGHGNTTSYSSPKQVGSLTTWAHSLGGTYWAGAVKTDNTLWTWGSGGVGRLGNNTTTTISSPVQVSAPSVAWKYAVGGQYQGGGETDEGYVYCWGNGAQGQIGNGAASNVSSPVQLGTEKWVSISKTTWGHNSHKLMIR